ncbi:MAG: FKBP-type peptidyl-prolyl cis-trans isomerase [Christensenellales bacterium]|jgi:trigger factor
MDYDVQMLRAAKGNRAAMNRLTEAGKGEAWLLCRLLTENKEEAVRVCREGYKALWETLKTESDPRRNTIELWTAICMARACQKAALEKDSGVFREVRVGPQPAGEDWEAAPADDKAAEAMLEAVMGMTLRRRFIWLLAKTRGLNPRQIAGVLKLREERVADSLSAAENDIRQALAARREKGKTAPAPGQAGELLALAAREALPEGLEAGIREDIANASPPVWKARPSVFWTGVAVALVLAALLPLIIVTALQTASKKDTAAGFDYSYAVEDNGFFTGIIAGDYVELCDYEGIVIPEDVHTVKEEDINAQVAGYLSAYTGEEQVTDRAVRDGDTLNIDYVGSVDGVEFEGGSTGGAGTTVTIGETNYIDDFLAQLIGHMPGETFPIEVTFPEDYGNEELSGKDAVFEIAIHYISESKAPALTDAFVEENFAEYGWSTVAGMRQGIEEDLRSAAVAAYLREYVTEHTVVKSLPEALVQYQRDLMAADYHEYAGYYGMETDAFISYYMAYDSLEALLDNYQEENSKAAVQALVYQAIAEAAGLEVTEEALAVYFMEDFGDSDYTSYAEDFGIGYLRYTLLPRVVEEYLTAHAVMPEA